MKSCVVVLIYHYFRADIETIEIGEITLEAEIVKDYKLNDYDTHY